MIARRSPHAASGCSHLRIEFALYVTSGTLLRESYLAPTIDKMQVEIRVFPTIVQKFVTTTRWTATSSYLGASYPPSSAIASISLCA